VAFDGSPRSREALFVGAYLAEQWKTTLTIFTALEDGRIAPSVQEDARKYLDLHEVQADYILAKGSAQAIRQILTEAGFNLLLLGSYGSSALQDLFIGSTLDFALRELDIPVFICR
jgi:nucleotide-binding universal stress UspA family protein